MKNKNAQKLGKLRWKGKSKKEKSDYGKFMVTTRELKRKSKSLPDIKEDLSPDLD